MTPQSPTEQALLTENAELRTRLEEAEEMLHAIHNGEVDALVINTSSGPQVFTLQGMDAELNRFRGKILEQVSDAVIVLDDYLHITYLNAAAAQQYGVIAAKALGRRVTEIYENRWLDPVDETIAMAILYKTGRWRGENIHVKRNGESIHVESSIVRLYAGNGLHSGLLAVIRDITERKLTEKALRASEARLAAIVHQATAGLVETDLSGHFILVNDQFCTMLGRRREELLQLCWQDLAHPDDLAEYAELFQFCAAGGGDFVAEHRYLRPDGSAVWVRSNVTLLHDGQGQPTSMLTVAFEIGERRKIEEQLREQARQLREAAERKDEFLAMLGHELRNPLTPISNMVQVIASRSLDEAKFSAAYEVLNRNVKHLSRLVDDLLDVTRITQGLITLKRERIELVSLLQECCETIADLTQAKQQTLHYELPGQPVYLEGDRVRLMQIFANLLNNASKYTDNNGRIDLAVSLDGPSVWVRIRDNGMGIAPELLPRIFDLFTQSAQGLDRAEGGLGVGLTLVKKLLELHGGHITAQSRGINQGSEFTVQLPILFESTAQAEPLNTQQLSKAVAQQQRILLIDDNRDVTDSMAMLFEMSGYQVETAHDGPQGLSAAQRFKPDVVLLDIGLPGMDGYQVARTLREQPSTQQALIIALSGHAASQNVPCVNAEGFDHCLIKPADFEHIQNLIAEYRLSAF